MKGNMIRKALNRVTFGVTPTLIKEVEEIGWEKWVDKQLALDGNDSFCQKQIDAIHYSLSFREKGKKKEKEFSLFLYGASQEEIWKKLKEHEKPPRWLIDAGAVETALVTWTKAIHSDFQIYEMLVEFWHNHFNVSVETEDYISAGFPIYDREVIRKNALGNFRAFTEDVAKSPAMLLYLDNAFSKASPANENYARELFELHTLGAMHYFNHLYDDWKQVPGAIEGKAEGYIDEDVYEAARAFTGWTIGTGKENRQMDLPDTGTFFYYDSWHDHYQKRVLGVEFKSHQDAMADGHKVLDLVCYHKGTAKHLCTKLCKWFVADDPPQELIEGAMKVWMDNIEADDQILKTVRYILTSDLFVNETADKVKRPNHLLFSMIRSLDLALKPNTEWVWMLEQMGWKQFSWPLPTGHPDSSNYWLNTDMLLKRWNSLPLILYFNFQQDQQSFFTDSTMTLPNTKIETIIDFWSMQLLEEHLSDAVKAQVKAAAIQDMPEMADQEWSILQKDHAEGLEYKIMQVVSLIALSPNFHKR